MDLQILTGELVENLLNYRLQNIYNVANSSRQYVLKFSIPDSKRSLVLDCGNKLHLTDFERPTAPAPSNFVTKLRKHLKTRRLSLLKQVGNDRVIVFQFSDGLYYLVFEFFSAGNVLLLDHERKILALLRTVDDLGDNEKYAVNEEYNMFNESLFDGTYKYEKRQYTAEDVKGWISAHKEKLSNDTSSKKKKVFSIHKLAFINASHLSNDLILKNLIASGINASQSCLGVEDDEELINEIVESLSRTEELYIALLENASSDQAAGFIVQKKNPSHNQEDPDSLEYIYDEFHPFLPYKENKDGFRFEEVKGYNKTLDKFFSTIESTKYALRVEQQKKHAQNRLDTAKSERDKQIFLLQMQQEINEKKGNSIMYHAELVETCKESVQTLIDKQMDWTNIESVIKMEQSRGSDIAKTIKLPLKLKDNKIQLLLNDIDAMSEMDAKDSDSESSSSDSESESDSETESDSGSELDSDSESEMPKKTKKIKSAKSATPKLSVEIDLALSAFANARNYFDSKKTAGSKQVKVEKSAGMALKNAERKIQKDLSKNLKNEQDVLQVIRPKYWFEKYFWFVTTDGYLCLAGRDDAQVDMIYYRHFSDSDYFVSSDIEGSLKVFIMNPFKGEAVSPSTLFQAGTFAMLTSNAWTQKVSSSAWWLAGPDVTKKEYDGSLLGPGRLNFKDKKNYMPPAQMVMGLAFYWLVDEDTAKTYTDAREKRQDEHGLKVLINNKKQDLENLSITATNVSAAAPVEEALSNDDVDGEDKKLSAKERRSIRRERALTPTSSEEPEANTLVNSIVKDLENVKVDEKVDVLKVKPAVRGKKGKMKKMNTKYADQDEEERKMRMKVLGTLKQIEELEQKKQEALSRAAEVETPKYAISKVEKDKKAEERELLKYLQEDDEEASDMNYLELLDSLVAKPAPKDTVAALVPVFAPWSSLSKFKYKVKIQPGMGKKGKALNDTMNYFSNRKVDPSREDLDVDWPNEHELIKAAKPNDLIGAFTANKVKLVLPGGAESDKGKKNGKKSSGKKK